jgi:hypothetical protein
MVMGALVAMVVMLMPLVQQDWVDMWQAYSDETFYLEVPRHRQAHVEKPKMKIIEGWRSDPERPLTDPLPKQ